MFVAVGKSIGVETMHTIYCSSTLLVLMLFNVSGRYISHRRGSFLGLGFLLCLGNFRYFFPPIRGHVRRHVAPRAEIVVISKLVFSFPSFFLWCHPSNAEPRNYSVAQDLSQCLHANQIRYTVVMSASCEACCYFGWAVGVKKESRHCTQLFHDFRWMAEYNDIQRMRNAVCT